jgi:hypothetical protein
MKENVLGLFGRDPMPFPILICIVFIPVEPDAFRLTYTFLTELRASGLGASDRDSSETHLEPATRSPALPRDVKLRAGRKPGGRPEGLPHDSLRGTDPRPYLNYRRGGVCAGTARGVHLVEDYAT